MQRTSASVLDEIVPLDTLPKPSMSQFYHRCHLLPSSRAEYSVADPTICIHRNQWSVCECSRLVSLFCFYILTSHAGDTISTTTNIGATHCPFNSYLVDIAEMKLTPLPRTLHQVAASPVCRIRGIMTLHTTIDNNPSACVKDTDSKDARDSRKEFIMSATLQ